MSHPDPHTPHVCYCQIPEDKLKELARLRFIEGIPTEEIMDRLKTAREKEYLAAVALLDVKVTDLPKIVPETQKNILFHLVDCRYHVKCILEDAGIRIEEKDQP